MAKIKFQSNPRVNQIFDDLEQFRQFCVDWGYRFDESYLYNMRNYAFQQFNKYNSGKNFKDQWADDLRKMNGYAQH
jgi:hypothetical protein